ncbi:MAG TPA: dihydrolipoyl dehydrogenase [Candidatus Methylacidiphilales bacterium]|nr:dihydrolipoyl dehydrogenase [Candidatus Methylacidiphilales bacterium]
MEYDLIVIGGGPAGYVGAIRAAQLGKKVACVDKERAGGTCLNWGCIPTKALIKNATYKNFFKHAGDYGFEIGEVKYDFSKIMLRSRGVADRMAKGIVSLFKGKKVDYYVGNGKVNKDKSVDVTDSEGKTQKLIGRNVLVATGCVPKQLPGLKPDGKRVFSSREALAMTEKPKSMIIIGAGAIGIEFAYFFNAFDTRVTVVEFMSNILPVEDFEVSNLVRKSFEKSGVQILTSTKVVKSEVTETGVKVTVEDVNDASKTSVLEADSVLVAVGVQANLEGALADDVKPELDRGYIKVNDRYESTVRGIFAAGDIIGPPWLAHVASHRAVEAVEGMFVPGKKPHAVTLYPGCTYCEPQVASIGVTEAKAKEQGLKFTVGKFPYAASGKAVAAGEPEGFVKLIIGEHGEILGAHIVGAEATEMIAEIGLAMNLEATTDELISTIHAHPTLSEMVHEASLASDKRAIHF